MPSERERDLDLVLWGATGYTGRLVARRLARRPGRLTDGLAWALGGRSLEKLEALRRELAEIEPGAAELPLLEGDSVDAASLEPIVARAKVVCSTVGPYSRYGTPLVRLCTDLGTDYCDLSGEVAWMRRNVDRFHERAKRSGARIVHSCGFDSIPSDLGTYALHHRLAEEGARLARARLRVRRLSGKMSGGTAASLFEIVSEARSDARTRRLLGDPYGLNPAGEREGPDRNEGTRPTRDDDRGVWTGPFLMAMINTRVVRRSNALLGYPYGHDFRYDERVDAGRGLSGRLRARALSTGLGLFTAAAALPPTAWALSRFVLPGPGEGPTAAERESGGFRITIYGDGERTDGETVRGQVTITAEEDPGYGATARMLAEAALRLVETFGDEAAHAADGTLSGGVLTPASALGLPLVERLGRAGVSFETTVE